MGDSKRQKKTEIEMGGDSKRQKKMEIEMGEKVEKVEKIEKVDKEESGSADFEELRDYLFREAAKLVSEVPSTKIAIWFTPPSESEVSVYSFGFPAVSGVVRPFFEDSCPVPVPVDEDAAEDEDGSCQGFWWEDKKLLESTNLEELDDAYDRMKRLKDRMILELDARSRAEESGNHQKKDVHNDKAQPKP